MNKKGMKFFALLCITLTSNFFIKSMEKNGEYPNFYYQVLTEETITDANDSLICRIEFPAMGKIDKAILERKMTEEKDRVEICNQLRESEKGLTIDPTLYNLSIPVAVVIQMEFFKQNRKKDALTRKIYSKFKYDKKRTEYKPIDNCTRIIMLSLDEESSASIICKTTLYDRRAIEDMLRPGGDMEKIWMTIDYEEKNEEHSV